jgi:phage terminase large subunit-like protein
MPDALTDALGMSGFDPRELTGAQRAALVEWFIVTYCRHRKGRLAGQSVVLERWAIDNIIRPIFGTVDRDGRRQYTEALIGLPRKHAKSLIAASVCLYGLFIEAIWEHGAEIYSLAGDKDQARAVFDTAKWMVEKDPFLDAYAKTYKDVIYVPQLESEFRVLSSESRYQHSLNPHFAIVDELHVHETTDQLEAMTSGQGAREEPLTLIITTAGKKRRGPLWDMLQKPPSATQYRYWVGAGENDPIGHKSTWRKATKATWIPMRYLQSEYDKLGSAAFEAYHLNRFPMTGGASRAFRMDEWAKCEKRARVDRELPCVITVDGANRGDCFAIIVDQLDANGMHNVEPYIFTDPPPDKGYYDLSTIEDLLVELWETRKVRPMAFDPSRLLMLMQRLQDVRGVRVEEFPQENRRMCAASATLRQVIRDKRIRAGHNPVLRDHVLNAVELDRQPWGWRIGKTSDAEKIDGAVALAMAVYLAENNPEDSRCPQVIVA